MAGSSFNPRPNSMNEVVDYVLNRLGAPLVEINVEEDQVLNRISDAIVYFQEHHVDGTYEGFFKTIVAPTALVVSTSVQNKAAIGESVISTGGFYGIICGISENFRTLYLTDVIGTVVASDEVTIEDRSEEFVVVSLTLGPAETGWITIPNNVEAITQVLQLPREGSVVASNTLAALSSDVYSPYSSVAYANQFFNYRGSGLGLSFYTQELRRETMAWLTTLQPWADFNRYTNRAYLNAFDYKANIGNWLVFKVMVSVDPEEFPEMYGDTWFLRYCVEQVRLQWGENLIKYDEVALLNGVKVNGTKIMEIAERRIKDLEEDMDKRYRIPDEFFLA